MGLSAHDQTFALRVDLKEITELSGVKKQAGAELYPKLSKKFKKVRKNCEKHQIFRKLAADSSADASADEVGRINIGRLDFVAWVVTIRLISFLSKFIQFVVLVDENLLQKYWSKIISGQKLFTLVVFFFL